MTNRRLKVKPALSPKERHQIEDLLGKMGYTVLGGGQQIDGSECDISFSNDGWQDRVHKEQDELSSKIEKLQDFISSERYADLDVINQGLLTDQLSTMSRYQQILIERISRF